jgi:hypothetical protein
MSNSSFSWWAVMLGTKCDRVVAPDRWYGRDGPQDFQEMYADDWIKCPVYYSPVSFPVTMVSCFYALQQPGRGMQESQEWIRRFCLVDCA